MNSNPRLWPPSCVHVCSHYICTVEPHKTFTRTPSKLCGALQECRTTGECKSCRVQVCNSLSLALRSRRNLSTQSNKSSERHTNTHPHTYTHLYSKYKQVKIVVDCWCLWGYVNRVAIEKKELKFQ